MPKVTSLDHLVLTVSDLEETVSFYCDVLGMEAEIFHPSDGSTRTALTFGRQKINLHPAAKPFNPKARQATIGSADLCFLTDTPIEVWQQELSDQIVEGPVARTGATGPIMSIYLRDPDGNLIEVSTPI